MLKESMTEKFDVIIVGAGPAGATAAYFLSHGGARVLVLDKARLPRYKPCAGGVPRSALALLPFSVDDAVECETERVAYCWQAGQCVSFPLMGRPVRMVMRDRFDWHILNRAKAAVRDQTRVRDVSESPAGVRVTTEAGDVLAADYLIGADGANSLVAHALNLRRARLVGAALEAEVTPDAATFERYAGAALFDFGAAPNGYLWIFAKRQHLSVGIGQLRSPGNAMRRTLQMEMERLGVRLDGATLHGHALPIFLGDERYQTDRTLLAGDAARLVDPLSGEGIRHAIASGRLAAEAILQGRASQYSAAIRRYVGRHLRPMLTLARLFYDHPWACYRYGVRNPRATRAFSRLVEGQTTAAGIMSTLALCLVEGLLRRA